MMTEGAGRIVNMSSIIASTGYSGLSVYGADQGLDDRLHQSLAREVGKAGDHGQRRRPGFIDTELTAGLGDEGRETGRAPQRASPPGRGGGRGRHGRVPDGRGRAQHHRRGDDRRRRQHGLARRAAARRPCRSASPAVDLSQCRRPTGQLCVPSIRELRHAEPFAPRRRLHAWALLCAPGLGGFGAAPGEPQRACRAEDGQRLDSAADHPARRPQGHFRTTRRRKGGIPSSRHAPVADRLAGREMGLGVRPATHHSGQWRLRGLSERPAHQRLPVGEPGGRPVSPHAPQRRLRRHGDPLAGRQYTERGEQHRQRPSRNPDLGRARRAAAGTARPLELGLRTGARHHRAMAPVRCS